MEINKALELGLEWAEKRMASELTEMDKEYILTGIKASLVKNCSIPNVSQQRELFVKFGKFAKNYKSGRDVEKAFDKWINDLTNCG